MVDVVKRMFVYALIEQMGIDNVAFAGLLASEHGSTVLDTVDVSL